MEAEYLGGNKFFITFIDDASDSLIPLVGVLIPLVVCVRKRESLRSTINRPHKKKKITYRDLRGSINSPTSTEKKHDFPLSSPFCDASWVTHYIYI